MTYAEKLAAAKEYLGEKWVFHKYNPMLRLPNKKK